MGLGPEICDRPPAGHERPRRLFVYNAGFLTPARVRRILHLVGYSTHLGLPGSGDAVAVWGGSPTTYRGLRVAQKRGVPVMRVENAFLRSLHPGRAGEAPLGLLIDHRGAHFDPRQPSDLERLLMKHPLDDSALLDRARACLARMKEAHLTKYAAVLPEAAVPEPGYVVVVDQARADASVTVSGADRARFLEMLIHARQENPGARILIKTHPETAQGFRAGHFIAADCTGPVRLFDTPISPWTLLEGAIAVYTVSSQLGFEAILMGHRPRLFGQPFYAGWGLSDDQFEIIRRRRALTRTQLFAAAMILYPKWYDPFQDVLCDTERAIDTLDAAARCWREDRQGWVASGMAQWKRGTLQRFYGRHRRVRFEDTPARARAADRPSMVWAGKAADGHADAARVEDGFLRSRGLGARLVAPMSLVIDDLGIYYDPRHPSRLEKWIAARATLRPDQHRRAARLIATLNASGLSKYNHGAAHLPKLPEGKRILVPGQVADDASVRRGADAVRDNLALLGATRQANPDAVILYKPPPGRGSRAA